MKKVAIKTNKYTFNLGCGRKQIMLLKEPSINMQSDSISHEYLTSNYVNLLYMTVF